MRSCFKYSHIPRLLPGLSLMLALFCAAACKPERKEEVKPPAPVFPIGVLAPLSGPYQAMGESIERGAKVAAAEINQRGGILGKQIDLKLADTTGDPERAAGLAQALIKDAKVKILIGTVSEAEALAVVDVATEMQTPFFYSADGALKTCKKASPDKLSDFVWSLGLSESMAIEPFLIHLSESFRQPESGFRFLYFGTDDPDSTATVGLVKQTVDGLAFENGNEFIYDLRIADYYDRIQGMLGFPADILVVTVSQENIFNFMEQAHKMSVRKDLIVTGTLPFIEENLRQMGKFADGVRTYTRYAHSIDSAQNRSFLEKWKALYPDPQMLPTALGVSGGYGGVMLAAKAFSKAGSERMELLQAAMKGIELDLPQGRVLMDPKSRSLIQPLFAVEFQNPSFVIKEFLGEISHAGTQDCHPLLVNPPKQKAKTVLAPDSIAEASRGQALEAEERERNP